MYDASCNNLYYLIRNSSADHLWQPEGLCKDPAQRGNTAKHERATQCHSVIKMYDGNKSLYIKVSKFVPTLVTNVSHNLLVTLKHTLRDGHILQHSLLQNTLYYIFKRWKFKVNEHTIAKIKSSNLHSEVELEFRSDWLRQISSSLRTVLCVFLCLPIQSSNTITLFLSSPHNGSVRGARSSFVTMLIVVFLK